MLSDLFGPDPAANHRRWVGSPRNPVIPPEGTGWAEDFIAACSVVEREGRLHLYSGTEGDAHASAAQLFVCVTSGRYRVHLATSDDGTTFTRHGDHPVLDVGPAGSWDGTR